MLIILKTKSTFTGLYKKREVSYTNVSLWFISNGEWDPLMWSKTDEQARVNIASHVEGIGWSWLLNIYVQLEQHVHC